MILYFFVLCFETMVSTMSHLEAKNEKKELPYAR